MGARRPLGVVAQEVGPVSGDLRRGIDRQRPLATIGLIGLPRLADRVGLEGGFRFSVEIPVERDEQTVTGNLADEGMIEDDEVVSPHRFVEAALAEFVEAAPIPSDVDTGMGGAIGRNARLKRTPAPPVIPCQSLERDAHPAFPDLLTDLFAGLRKGYVGFFTYASRFFWCRNTAFLARGAARPPPLPVCCGTEGRSCSGQDCRNEIRDRQTELPLSFGIKMDAIDRARLDDCAGVEEGDVALLRDPRHLAGKAL